MLSEVFWSFLITSVIGCVFGIAKMAYKSKCSDVEMCCIKFHREVETEQKLDYAVIHRQESQGENNL